METASVTVFKLLLYEAAANSVHHIVRSFVSTDGLATINPTRQISLKICKRGNLKTERRN